MTPLIFEPRDSYRQRIYLEPLGLYVQADTGLFQSVSLNLASQSLEIHFVEQKPATFSTRRIRLDKEAASRPGQAFKVVEPEQAQFVRGAYEVLAAASRLVVTWDEHTAALLV